MTALAGLAGAVIGGVLVLVANILVRRSEERQRWAEHLRLAAADAIAPFAAARSTLVVAREEGQPCPGLDRQFLVERNRADALFAMTPGAEPLRDTFAALRDGLHEMRQNYDHDEGFRVAWEKLGASLEAAEDAVRQTLERSRIRRG